MKISIVSIFLSSLFLLNTSYSQNEKFIFEITGVNCFNNDGLTKQFRISQSIVIDEDFVTIYAGNKVNKEKIISVNKKNSQELGEVLSIIAITDNGKQINYMIFVDSKQNNKIELAIMINSEETCFFESKFTLN